MTNNRPILVLGGTGFIGTEVVKALRQQYPEKHLLLLKHHRSANISGIETLEGSLEKFDWSQLDTNPPAHIIHLARINATRFGKWGRRLAARRGKEANERLIKHLSRNNWNCAITYVSGSLVYGDQRDKPVYEDHPLNPTSFAREYALAEEPFTNTELNVRLVRVPWVLGNGSWFKSFFLKPMKEERYIPKYGTGQGLMSFLDVEDAGRGIAYIAMNLNRGTYHLSIPGALRQEEFCDLLATYTASTDMREASVNRRFDPALKEAFSASIVLESHFRKNIPESIYRFRTVEEMIRERLPAFFKDEEGVLS